MTTILSLDPSADVTGAVAVRFGEDASRTLLLADAFDATHAEELGTRARRDGSDALRRDAALCRIRWTRRQISSFHACLSIVDVIAFEGHTGQGSSSPTMDMAIGAYLSLSVFDPFVPVMVTRQSACTATGTYDVYRQPAGKTDTERDAKKARLKAAVLAWAKAAYPGFAWGEQWLPKQEAIADALAVAEATYQGLIKEEHDKQIKRLASGQKAMRLTGGVK